MKNEPFGIEIELAVEPVMPLLQVSGRSCSIAWPVFFARQAMTSKEAVKPGHRDGQADEAACANPTIKADPSMPASFTSTDSESENPPLGNPLRFRTVENRPKFLLSAAEVVSADSQLAAQTRSLERRHDFAA